jgi:hypothetical protein
MTQEELQARADAEAAREESTETGTETPSPTKVKVNLGDQSIELDEEQAGIVRRAMDKLAGHYGSQLEEVRRHALSGIGRPETTREEPRHLVEQPPFSVPNTDLLFSDKATWERGFIAAVDERLDTLRRENEALVQAAVEIVQEDFSTRDNQRRVVELHDRLEREMFASLKPDVREHPEFINAVKLELEKNGTINHLPANVAYERIGTETQRRWDEIHGIKKPVTPAPRLLSGSSRAARSSPETYERGSLSERILERQAQKLGTPSRKSA